MEITSRNEYDFNVEATEKISSNHNDSLPMLGITIKNVINNIINMLQLELKK